MQPSLSRPFSFWQRFLLIVGLVYVLFGLGLTLLNATPLFDPLHKQVDYIFWGSVPISEDISVFRAWIYGTAGATITSWGVFVAYIAHYALSKKEKWAWNCLLVATLAWYVLDFGTALTFRVTFNAIFSTLSMLVVIVPLMFLRKYIF